VNDNWKVGQSVEVRDGGDKDGGACGNGCQSATANWGEN
jgi:hypothetical protein